MKKVFAVLALVGVMASCNNKKKDEKKPEGTDTTTTTTTTTTTEVTTTTPGVPTFSDPDVQAYVQAYEDYIAMYKQAVEGKDMTKMADLAKTGQDLATKGTAAAQKLATSPEDAKKLAEYMTAKATEVTELAKKLTGQ